MATLAQKLRRARREAGLNRQQLANELPSVGRQTIVNLEEGVAYGYRAPIQTAVELVDFFWPDIQLEDFIHRDSEVRVAFKRKR